jgi:hypothetical protein
MMGYPAVLNGKQNRQTIGMIFRSTTAINGFTIIITQSIGVVLNAAESLILVWDN